MKHLASKYTKPSQDFQLVLFDPESSKQASVLHWNDMKKLKNEMRWKMNKQYEMEFVLFLIT